MEKAVAHDCFFFLPKPRELQTLMINFIKRIFQSHAANRNSDPRQSLFDVVEQSTSFEDVCAIYEAAQAGSELKEKAFQKLRELRFK